MKYLSILFAFIVVSLSAKAQDHKLQIGVLGGADTYLQSEDYYFSDYQYGWSTGISLQHNLLQRFSLNYRVLYREEIIKQYLFPFCGTGLIHEGFIGRGTSKYKSIIVPVLAKWTFGQKKWHWMVDIGVQGQLNFENVWMGEYHDSYSYSGFNNDTELNLGLSSAAGITYDVTENISVSTEFRVTNFDILDDVSFVKEGLNGQLFIGVTYGLGKK